jgi:ethanolamine utilization protein EutN
MKVATVVGTVISTINHPFFDGRRLMVCDVMGGDGEADGYQIAVDTVGAGEGETVLILDEGNSSRQVFGIATGPIRTTIVAIVDDYDL